MLNSKKPNENENKKWWSINTDRVRKNNLPGQHIEGKVNSQRIGNETLNQTVIDPRQKEKGKKEEGLHYAWVKSMTRSNTN